MVLPIKIYPNKILRKKCKEVKKITEIEKKLIKDMFETMYKNNGVGLAAPQVGVLKRIIVVDVGQGAISLINPKIVKKIGRAKSTEGCLSIPGVTLEVRRSAWVKVRGLSKNDKLVTIKAEGLLAFALQHEIDHLNGVLIYDRVSLFSKIKNFLTRKSLDKNNNKFII